MMPVEQCYGIVVVYKDTEDLFLILQHDNAQGSWSFPKGHHEGNETPQETARRELFEETQIKDIELLDTPLIYEEYEITRKGEKRRKINEYFVGYTTQKDVMIQEDEIHTYKWVNYDDAIKLFGAQASRKEVLAKAKEYLSNS